MARNIDWIIDRLGGAEAASRLTGVSTEAVRKWRQAGTVPSKHWSAVIAATGLSMADLEADEAGAAIPEGATAVLVLADGTALWGRGFGAHTPPEGCQPSEVCFSTGMTGYQETLTDPSFAGQIITFTFPHIGNVGANGEDIEAATIAARGLVVKQDVTAPSSWRATQPLDAWLRGQGVPGLAGVDTRMLTRRIRDDGAPSGVLAYPADGRFDLATLRARAAGWAGLEGLDLARDVSCTQSYQWDETVWAWPDGFGRPDAPRHHVVDAPRHHVVDAPRHHVVAVDYGAKRNILRSLASAGCRVTVVPATATAEDILRHRPDGVFLSNGPGDPAATAEYAAPAIRAVIEAGIPLFGICLGHQLLALALGGRTYKLARGHRGANQPVQELATGRVEITSQNHGFAVDEASLPKGVVATHKSLFDGSNEGLAVEGKPIFSVQYHPEASPGPSDARHLFHRFTELMSGLSRAHDPVSANNSVQ